MDMGHEAKEQWKIPEFFFFFKLRSLVKIKSTSLILQKQYWGGAIEAAFPISTNTLPEFSNSDGYWVIPAKILARQMILSSTKTGNI